MRADIAGQVLSAKRSTVRRLFSPSHNIFSASRPQAALLALVRRA